MRSRPLAPSGGYEEPRPDLAGPFHLRTPRCSRTLPAAALERAAACHHEGTRVPGVGGGREERSRAQADGCVAIIL